MRGQVSNIVLKELAKRIHIKQEEENEEEKEGSNLIKINFSLQKCTFALLKSKMIETTPIYLPVAEIDLMMLNLNMSKLENYISVSCALDSIMMIDYISVPGSKHMAIMPANIEEKQMKLKVEINPVEGNADTSIAVVAQSFDYYLSMRLIEEIVDFFGSYQSDFIEGIAVDIEDKLLDQAESKLKEALHSSNSLEIDLQLEAPNIIISENWADPNSHLVVFVLGNLQCKTDKESLKKYFSNQEISNISNEEQANYYTKYHIDLKNMQALFTSSRNWRETTNSKILDNFDLSLDVSLCKISTFSKPKLILSSDISPISSYFSTSILADLVKVFQTLVPLNLVDKQLKAKPKLMREDMENNIISVIDNILEEKNQIENLAQILFSFLLPKFSFTLYNEQNIELFTVKFS